MDYKSVEKRLLAAHTLLESDTVDASAFQSLTSLLHGIHPRIDKTLTTMGHTATHIDMLQKGYVISLTAQSIPAHTPQEKKRKKYLLLFLKYWRDLKSEVARVEKELSEAGTSHGNSNLAWANLFATAKGPLGIITVIAAGIVMLKVSEVSVTIKNIGCRNIDPSGDFSVNVPGLSLPTAPIADGEESVAKLPPISITVDATNDQAITVLLYGVTRSFILGSSHFDILYDGQLLNGKLTSVQLASAKSHTVEIRCR